MKSYKQKIFFVLEIHYRRWKMYIQVQLEVQISWRSRKSFFYGLIDIDAVDITDSRDIICDVMLPLCLNKQR